jgi:hypothetical protein
MARRRLAAEQIVTKLRHIEVLQGLGKTTLLICSKPCAPQTASCWPEQFMSEIGGLVAVLIFAIYTSEGQALAIGTSGKLFFMATVAGFLVLNLWLLTCHGRWPHSGGLDPLASLQQILLP